MFGVINTTPSWCVMCKCGLEPLHFNLFCAARMRLYNSLIKSNSYTMKKVLHADMQLSIRSNDCWSAHIVSAMDDLTRSYDIFKQKLQNCEPIDLSCFVVTSKRDNWRIGHLIPTCIRESTMHSNRATYHRWCALPT